MSSSIDTFIETSLTDEPLGQAILGLFDHCCFKDKSTWVPENTPTMIDSMISVNELNLVKTKLHAPRRQNLSKKEKLAIKELAGNREIVIKKADKGSCVVIMNTTDYINEGHRQLSDSKFYKRVDGDLTIEHNVKVESIANMKSMIGMRSLMTLQHIWYIISQEPHSSIYCRKFISL